VVFLKLHTGGGGLLEELHTHARRRRRSSVARQQVESWMEEQRWDASSGELKIKPAVPA
jgi:hypothetical protein